MVGVTAKFTVRDRATLSIDLNASIFWGLVAYRERVERGGGPFSIEKKYSETRNNKAGERERGAGENSEFGGGALVCVCAEHVTFDG